MDTREKITSLDQIRAELAESSWIVLTGRFDPLTAVAAQDIAGAKQADEKLLVVVEAYEEQLLDVQARAILVAALRVVDRVLIDDGSLGTELRTIAGRSRVLTCGDRDEERRREFDRIVVERSRATSDV